MPKLDIKQKLLIIFFLSLPYVDLITSLTTRFTTMPISLGVIVKGISLLFSLAVIIVTYSTVRKKAIGYLIVICIFAIVYFITKPDIWQFSSIFTEVMYAFKYLYFPLMTIFMYVVFRKFNINVNMIKGIIVINALVYAALVLIPYFTNTGFKSYDWGFTGNTGWFYAANEIGAILTVLSAAVYILMDNRNKWKLLFTIPILFALSTMGTKVSYLGMIAVVFISIIVFIVNNRTDRFKLPLALLCILIVCSLTSNTVDNMNTLAEMELFPPTFEMDGEGDLLPEDSTLEPQESTLEMIQSNRILYNLNRVLSSRVLYFLENWKCYIDGGVTTILLGLGWVDRTAIDYTYYKKVIEIDLLDIWLHYGIIGFGVYFAPFLYLLYKFIKNIKKVKTETFAYVGVILLSMGISTIAGHILGAPSVSIYLILLIMLVVLQMENA